MRRKDMQRGTLYAIIVNGMARPGFIDKITVNPHKLPVRTCWTWPGQEDDYLNPAPPVTDERCKWDDGLATTAEIIELWADYSARVKAERAERLRAHQVAEQAHADEIADQVRRVKALEPLIGTYKGYLDLSDLVYLCQADRAHDSRYSAKHVLDMLEHVASVTTSSDTGVSQWTPDDDGADVSGIGPSGVSQ